MAEPWNLTSEEWARVLSDGDTPQTVAQRLLRGNYLPWNEVLQRYTNDAKRILDLGSGRGENSAMLALQNKETTLFDWSQENLEFSKQVFSIIGKQARFVQGDMTKSLPFMNDEFDVVFSCGVFEYFSDDQISDILKEIFRVTRRRAIILVPNAYSVFYRLGMWYMRIIKKWPWGGERPLASLHSHFSRAGFKNIREFTVAAKHSLTFLTMPGGRTMQKILIKLLKLHDHAQPSRFRQGYLLISVGDK